MKIFLILLLFLMLHKANAQETINCVIIKKNDKILIQEGKNCDTPYSPNSSFKIPLAVIGFESGILNTAHSPVWKPQKPVTFMKEFHDGEQSPSSWMRFSMPWYSKILTQKLGMKKFQEYIDKMQYGNMDLSGDAGSNNGLTDSWLSSSLKISPIEQIAFIEKLAKNQLAFSKSSQEKTKDIMKGMYESSLIGSGYIFYGKTGSSDFDKSGKREGYFVGFIKKNDEIITAVVHIDGGSGQKAKKIGIEKLSFVLKN